jgi:hypothetical protein
MDMEGKIREAITAELKRQCESDPDELKVVVRQGPPDPSFVTINGTVDLDSLAMAIAGALAGGP